MNEPIKLTQEDIELIEHGVCPKCEGEIDMIDPTFFRCDNCNLNFYFPLEDQGVFLYECLNCEYSSNHIGNKTYESMICPKCSHKALVRVVPNKDSISFY